MENTTTKSPPTTKNKLLRFVGFFITAFAANLLFSVTAGPSTPYWVGAAVGALASGVFWYFPGMAVVNDESSTKRIYTALAFSVFVLIVVMIPVARMAGAEAARQSEERLALVWPNVMQMPEGERAFVVALAMNCRLEKRPAIKSEVIACLKEGATAERGTFPVGLDHSSAPGKLDQILVIANNESQKGDSHE